MSPRRIAWSLGLLAAALASPRAWARGENATIESKEESAGVAAARRPIAAAYDAARGEAALDRAVTLFDLGYMHSAHASFAALVGETDPAARSAALPWLAELARLLPEAAGVGVDLARYGAELARLRDPRRPELFAHASYLAGRSLAAAGRHDDALERLLAVEEGSRDWPAAQLWIGTTNVLAKRSIPGVEAFRRVIAAAQAGRATPEMRELAWLSLGRLLYTASLRLDENNALVVDERTMSAAIAAFRRVAPASVEWPAAQRSLAWAYVMAGERARALGALFSLDTPFAPEASDPEDDVMRAMLYLDVCDYDRASDVVSRVGARWTAAYDVLVGLSKRSDDELYATPTLRRTLGTDRATLRALAYVDALDAESRRLAEAPNAGVPLLADAASSLRARRAVAFRDAMARVRSHLGERLSALKTALTARVSFPMLSEGGGGAKIRAPLRVADDEIAWPFDGEYWRDELGTYREVLSDGCGRGGT